MYFRFRSIYEYIDVQDPRGKVEIAELSILVLTLFGGHGKWVINS